MKSENQDLVKDVFEQLEADRKSGKLTADVLKSGGYGISAEHPNHISKYNSNGELQAIGIYQDGKFIPSKTFNVMD